MKDFLDLEKIESDYVGRADDLEGISGPLVTLVKDLGSALEHKYPGWLWAVEPFEYGAIIKIFSLRLSGEYGYILKVPEIQNDPNRVAIAVRAGGEILERYGFPRGPYRRELTLGKVRDIRGNFVPDISDKDSREQKRDRDRLISRAVEEGTLELRTVDHKQEDGSVYRELHMRIGGDDDDS